MVEKIDQSINIQALFCIEKNCTIHQSHDCGDLVFLMYIAPCDIYKYMILYCTFNKNATSSSTSFSGCTTSFSCVFSCRGVLLRDDFDCLL